MSGREAFSVADHERARELAAARIDELLPPSNEAWLADHLERCAPCAAVAAEYDAHHDLFSALREATPQPPRDLWARTAATLDAERSRGRVGRWRRLRGSPGRSTRLALAPVVATVAVVVVVGAGLLNGRPTVPGGTTGAAATPILIKGAADLQVLSLDSAGNLQLLSRRVDEVCPTGVTECGVSPTFAVTAVSAFGSAADLVGAMSPSGSQMVVVRRDPGSQGVYVVPVKPAATPATSSHPARSPHEASSAGASASASASLASAPPASPLAGSAWPSTSAAVSADDSPAVAESPVPPDGPVTASASDGLTPPPSDGSVGASPSEGIEPGSSSSSPEPTVGPSVEVSPAPNSAIKIASDVTVVGAPTYSPDGTRLAFSAMPSDASAGPDIYVWAVGDTVAQAITTDHDSWLAGWTDAGILVSRVDNGLPTTYQLDPATDLATAIGAPGTWLPSVSPTGTAAGWWSGTVKLAPDGVTWVPDAGRLVLGAWPSTDAAPISSQVLAEGPIDAWQVRWDNTGAVVAVWEGQGSQSQGGEAQGSEAPGSQSQGSQSQGSQSQGSEAQGSGAPSSQPNEPIGRLTLYSVDQITGAPDLANPMLNATPANPDFSLRAGRLAWTTPDQGLPQTVEVLAWSGKTVYPTMQLPADGSGTVVR